MSQQPVRIVGAGIGGLTLARCLLHHGVPAVVYEKMPATSRHSYGVTLHESSYKPLLDILGLDEWSFRRRIAVDGMLGGSGVIDPESVLQTKRLSSTSFRAHRGKLEKLLREGIDLRWGHDLEKVEETSTGMVLCLQNGQRLRSAGIIGVDGPHSNTRKSLSPDTPFNILPYVAFNGKRRVSRALFDSTYAPAMNGSNVLEFKHGDSILNISINEHNGDIVNVGWIYSRPARGSTDPLYRPNRPVSRATDIPDEFFTEVGALADLQQPFKEVFDPEKLREERVLHWLMRSVLVRQQELRRFADKGVFFMGDSVHAEPILGGEGANNAITDAVGLAKCISTSGLGGITSWYETRYPAWENSVRRSEDAIAKMHNERSSAL
ncbi:FAD-dependent monooxygenase nscC [Paramyrothecium foliicola]|nr:FAD-dependent monooxygenase nscC [Paramyrothecium foliicola]